MPMVFVFVLGAKAVAVKFHQKCWRKSAATLVPNTLSFCLCALHKLVGEIDSCVFWLSELTNQNTQESISPTNLHNAQRCQHKVYGARVAALFSQHFCWNFTATAFAPSTKFWQRLLPWKTSKIICAKSALFWRQKYWWHSTQLMPNVLPSSE